MKHKFLKNLTRPLRPICAFVILAFTTSGWAQSEVAEVHAPSPDASALDNFGWSCSISGDTAVVGAKWDTHSGETLAGSAYIYQRDQGGTDNWGYVATLRPFGLEATDFFGSSVSISGDIAVVGAPQHDVPTNNEGSVYIFYRDQDGDDEWGLMTTLTGDVLLAQFGFSVCIKDDLIIVGEPNCVCGYGGRAHIFGRNQGGSDNWGEIAAIFTLDGKFGDEFGRSVSINGSDLAIVGAPFDELITVTGNPVAGSAYIFERDEGGTDNWGLIQKLNGPSPAYFDLFGWSVSISGETVIIGKQGDNAGGSNAGAAYIFEPATPFWDLVKTLTASDAAANDQFGISVSISNEGALVGAHQPGDGGAAYMFRKNEGGPDEWEQVGDIIVGDDTATNDEFGISVSLDGDRAIIGGHLNDDNGSGSGSAYVFDGVCPCPWDLNEDSEVSTQDLLELFAQWGVGPDKPADFDDDEDVDTEDLLTLLANWGVCPCVEGTDPPSIEAELADACISEAEWDEYVEVMTGSANQATKDRFKCWMEHYINDCNRCSCLGASGCPAPDPFD